MIMMETLGIPHTMITSMKKSALCCRLQCSHKINSGFDMGAMLYGFRYPAYLEQPVSFELITVGGPGHSAGDRDP